MKEIYLVCLVVVLAILILPFPQSLAKAIIEAERIAADDRTQDYVENVVKPERERWNREHGM